MLSKKENLIRIFSYSNAIPVMIFQSSVTQKVDSTIHWIVIFSSVVKTELQKCCERAGITRDNQHNQLVCFVLTYGDLQDFTHFPSDPRFNPFPSKK